ncbi:hypothetical protein [Rhizobium grahamii]|uniref:Nodulation protein n=1 Tax=Rhizobium grahamii CCGE 502 TaxID=990285 RepID=S3ICW2_9HYPH|nr:hypothetical protein [Rhizobium grahamii]EPE97008.1 nodulation protein [Rhizobium grahamii CCGE 502]
MSSDHGKIGGSYSAAQSGLRRLMLRLPEHRRRLQSLPGSTSWPFLHELLEAYDEACVALEAFRRKDETSAIIDEYVTVVAELEADIVRELDRIIVWPRD